MLIKILLIIMTQWVSKNARLSLSHSSSRNIRLSISVSQYHLPILVSQYQSHNSRKSKQARTPGCRISDVVVTHLDSPGAEVSHLLLGLGSSGTLGHQQLLPASFEAFEVQLLLSVQVLPGQELGNLLRSVTASHAH